MQIEEGKPLGTIRGKPDPTKQQHIQQRHAQKRFVSSLRAHAKQASKRLDSETASLERHLTRLVKQYRAGDITFRKLKSQSRKLLAASTEMAFRLGIKAAGVVSPTGSLQPLTKHEQRWLNSYLKEELKYWDKFLGDIVVGQSDKRVAQRIGNYVKTTRSAYESGRVLSVGPEVVIHWVLESNNPCPDCKLLAKYSPYTAETLPTTPKGGQTRCLSHCYCSLRIVKTSPAEVSRVKKKNKSAKWYLNKIKANRKKR